MDKEKFKLLFSDLDKLEKKYLTNSSKEFRQEFGFEMAKYSSFILHLVCDDYEESWDFLKRAYNEGRDVADKLKADGLEINI